MLADNVLTRLKNRPGVNASFITLSPEGQAICEEIEAWLAAHPLTMLRERNISDIPVKQR